MNWHNIKRWLWLGVAAYFIFLVVNLPASLATKLLAQANVTSAGSSGTLWSGQALGVQAGMLNLGNVQWQIRLLPILSGKLAADVQLKQVQGYAQAHVAWSWNGTLTLTDVSASLPLQSIVGSGGLPGGWVGTAQARLDELVLKNDWPVAASGSIDVVDLTGPAQSPSNIGSYRLTLPAEGSNEQTLVGSLQDANDAAIEVSGTLKLNTDHSYEMDTLVKARDNAPQDIIQGMQYLGTTDGQGRRPFSVSGSF